MAKQKTRLISVLLVLVMLFILFPAALAADETGPSDGEPVEQAAETSGETGIMPLSSQATIPAEMWDNSILRALAYTGYDVQHQKNTNTLYELNYISGSLAKNDPDVLSGIGYSTDGSGSGLETTADSSTATGLAPDISTFQKTGFDCADFVTYYIFNYLPNIEGEDISMFTQMRQKYGIRPDNMRFWKLACEDLASQGRIVEYKLTVDDSSSNTAAYQNVYQNVVPGDIIRFGSTINEYVHYAVYAGTYNGRHYIIHVGNSRGPEISIVEYMASSGSSKQSWPLAFYHLTDLWEETGAIEIMKTDPNGKNLSGATFTATNTATGDIYSIGPTDGNGYAKNDEIPFGTYIVQETVFPDGYTSDGTNTWTVTLDGSTPNGIITISAVNVPITGKLRIVKATNTGEDLSGWQFLIYSDAACTNLVSGPVTSGSDGTIDVTLVPGTYYVKEVPKNDPYWECDTSVQCIVVSANATASVTFKNHHYGKLIVYKETNTGENLEGWQFNVYSDSACTKLVTTLTTSTNGTATSGNLEPGTYYVKEVPKNDPYWECDTSVKTATVAAGQTVRAGGSSGSFTNKHLGKITIHKSTNTGEDLEGWEFGVYRDAACTQLVTTMSTGPDGVATSENLEPGTYYIREIGNTEDRFVDEYWVCDITVQEVTVTAGETAELTKAFENIHYGKIRIIKSMDTDGPLEGWQFEIYRQEESGDASSSISTAIRLEYVGTYTSAADGTILTGNLEPGTYVVKEIIPDGSLYECKTENPQTVIVVAGETAEVTFTNALRPGRIVVEKVNFQGGHLAGARFLLEWSGDGGATWQSVTYSDKADVVKGGCSNPNLADGCLTSGEDGIVEWSNLYPGIRYRVTEVEAPEGYSLLTDYAFVGELPAENLTVELTVVNASEFTLPMTGSHTLALMPIVLALCAALGMGALLYRRKE